MKKKKSNWGYAILAVYLIFVACMVAFVIKASHQKYDLVSEKYYDEAVAYQDKIEGLKNGQSEQSNLSVEYSGSELMLKLQSKGVIKNSAGTVSFKKPDDASKDFRVNFSIDDSGKEDIDLKGLKKGYWNLTVEWNLENKNFLKELRIYIP